MLENIEIKKIYRDSNWDLSVDYQFWQDVEETCTPEGMYCESWTITKTIYGWDVMTEVLK